MGLDVVPSSEDDMFPSEQLCFLDLMRSDLLLALGVPSPFEAVVSDVGRDHSGAESETIPVWKPL